MARQPSPGPRSRVGQHILDRRTQLGLEQDDLAKRSQYSRGYIGRVERERIAPHISDDFVEKMAAALEESADTFRAAAGLKRPNPFDIDVSQLTEDERRTLEHMRRVNPDEEVLTAWLETLPIMQTRLGLGRRRSRGSRAEPNDGHAAGGAL